MSLLLSAAEYTHACSHNTNKQHYKSVKTVESA